MARRQARCRGMVMARRTKAVEGVDGGSEKGAHATSSSVLADSAMSATQVLSLVGIYRAQLRVYSRYSLYLGFSWIQLDTEPDTGTYKVA